MVHVLPCGGYSNVIDLADDVVRNNLLGKKTSICIILDLDIKTKAENYIRNNNIANNIPLNYLPIESLEKYLKNKLVDNVDHALFRRLNDYIFQQKSLTDIVNDYTKKHHATNDDNGKILYRLIDAELRERRKDRNELIEMVVEYLFEKNDEMIKKTVAFLNSRFKNN